MACVSVAHVLESRLCATAPFVSSPLARWAELQPVRSCSHSYYYCTRRHVLDRPPNRDILLGKAVRYFHLLSPLVFLSLHSTRTVFVLCSLGHPDIADDDEEYSDSSTPSSIHSGTSFSAEQGPTAQVYLPILSQERE